MMRRFKHAARQVSSSLLSPLSRDRGARAFPAPFIAPWLIIPLGIAAWGVVGLGASVILHWVGL